MAEQRVRGLSLRRKVTGWLGAILAVTLVSIGMATAVGRWTSTAFDAMLADNSACYTVQDALAAKWRKIGLTVEQVSVQDVRYGEAITKKYTEAQAAEIDKQKALNEQQVAKTEAETKKIKAQGEADANAVLNESLTDNVLKQHYIDALSNADQLVVVPDGADTLVQTK